MSEKAVHKSAVSIIAVFLSVIMLVSQCRIVLSAKDSSVKNCELIVEFEESADSRTVINRIRNVLGGKLTIAAEYNRLLKGIAVNAAEDELSYVCSLLYSVKGVKKISSSLEYSVLEDESESQTVNNENSSNRIKKDNTNYVDRLEDLSVSNAFKGERTVVAVLDSGFICDDEYFVLSRSSERKLTKEEVAALKQRHGLPGTYYSDKIPYIYDYGDKDNDVSSSALHGQHVAGIIAGNPVNVKKIDKSISFSGVVPEAQLILMKVFTDTSSTAKTSAILNALEDAVELGANVINLSFGVACGNDKGKPLAFNMYSAIESAKENGVFVVCASGNAGVSGSGSIYDEEYGLDLPTSEMIDIGTVASPASCDVSFTVGSYTEEYRKHNYFVSDLGESTRIIYTDTNMYYSIGSGSEFFELVCEEEQNDSMGNTVYGTDFVYIKGNGTEEDFLRAGNIDGKLAMVRYRGEVSLENKLIYAKASGAKGVIFYADEDENAEAVYLNLANAVIPAILISYGDAQMLKENTDSELRFSKSYYFYKYDESDIKIADYSSSGISGDISIKPDLLAPGTDISSRDFNRFLKRTGTSMAAAYVSGVTAALIQYRKKAGLDISVSTIEAVLMNSALPVKEYFSGYEYSPRLQGAGRADFGRAVNSSVLLLSSGGKAKFEMKNRLSLVFGFELVVKNTTNKTSEYYLSLSVMGDAYIEHEISDDSGNTKTVGFNTLEPYAFDSSLVKIGADSPNANRNSSDFKAVKVQVNGNSSVKLNVTVFMDAKTVGEHYGIFKNGFYIDGYVNACDENGNVLASVPYVGFYGNQASQKALDYSIYDEETSFYNNTYLYSFTNGAINILGRAFNGANTESSYNYISFSPNGDNVNDKLMLSLGLMRNLSSLSYTVTNVIGRTVYSSNDLGYFAKTHSLSDTLICTSIELWNGLKRDGTAYPDGLYYVTVKAKGDYDGAETEILKFPVTIDTKAPQISKSYIENDSNGNIYLVLELSDTHGTKSVEYYSYVGENKIKDSSTNYYVDQVESGKSVVYKINISYIDSDSIYISLCDYANNRQTYKFYMSELFGVTEQAPDT